MQEQLSQQIQEAELQSMMNSLSTQLNTITSLDAKYNGRKSLIQDEVNTYKKNHPDNSQPVVYSELPRSVSFFGPNGEVAKADLYTCITNIIDILNAPHVGKPLISVYYDVLKGRLPFEANAGESLYNFINYVTDIETTGLSLYSAYALFNNNPDLEADLNTLTGIYKNSVVEQETGINGKPALLPSADIFKVKTKYGAGKIGVKLNYNGKYYAISDGNWTMKDNLVYKSGGDYYARMANIGTQDFKDLFHYKDLYYPNMSPKTYLVNFGGFNNVPDWFIYDYASSFYWFLGPRDCKITFYDTADNVYREYFASDLYNNYSGWCAKMMYVYNW
jgi:hypothetical protein